ncbi:MAG: hypothetical protein LBT88_06840 [Oscillospiraceae bacterium]|jgi:hypothetical protein|nr:hypothetical protein [Oscillospiraceae bacterium]
MLSLTRSKIIQAARKIALLLILYFLQVLFANFRIFGAVPLLLPAGAIGLAMFAEGGSGALWGLTAGILCDVSIGGSPLMFTVLLAAVGLGAGFMTEFYFARTFTTYTIITLVSVALCCVVEAVPPIVFNGVSITAALQVVIAECAYSFIISLPLYPLMRKFI